MEVILWGVRGTAPVPGPGTVRYGGNTPCIEVLSAGGASLLLDAGADPDLANRSGISPRDLVADSPLDDLHNLL